MPLMETITIVNKSGKVVSTGKHLVNIFKDAKDAYLERKSEMRAEHREKIEYKQAQKLLEARKRNYPQHDDSRSVASSHRPRRDKHRDGNGVSRPPLTERALSQLDDGASVASSRRGSRSHHPNGSRRGSVTGERERYRKPYVEDAGVSQPHLARRHTDYPPLDTRQASLHPPVPVPHPRQISRSTSNPDLRYGRDHIDMNLAYGELPPDLMHGANSPTITEREREIELKANMSKLDQLLLEAHCVQHSATAIIKNLQANPEAMAAVALTLAEISNLLKKMSPAILTALKSSSPAAFALLASPQFLIAGGLALGVTVVMFGGYKIVKKIQDSNALKKENQVDEALVWDQHEMGSIETWRRGIEYGGAPGSDDDNTTVDGEFITPEAARQRKERVREMRREERREAQRSAYVGGGGSIAGESDRTIRRVRSDHTLRTVGSDSTIRRKAVPLRTKTDVSVTSRSVRGKEIVEAKDKKKSSALSIIFNKKTKEEKKDKKKDGKKGKAGEV